MNDEEFFDLIYSQWSKTTGAEDTYWMPEKFESQYPDVFKIYAVAQDQSRKKVGIFNNEVDADFITAVHGCMPDLVRRLHSALDEADRADREHDQREQEIGRLALENMELRQQVEQIKALQRDDRQTAIDAIAERDEAVRQIETMQSKAADVLWKIERPM